MSDYERAILRRLLEVDFAGREALRNGADTLLVRTIDECGCIEFFGGEGDGEARVVTEGWLPPGSGSGPLEIMLTLRDGHPLWLEFHRYGGENDIWPEPDAFEVARYPADR